MSRLIVIEWRRPRVWIGGVRIHHGALGIILGFALALHDWRDRKQWFRIEHMTRSSNGLGHNSL